MPGTSAVLTNLFARHPSSLTSSGFGGQYRLICPSCGNLVVVAIAQPAPAALDIRCGNCGWSEHLGESMPPPVTRADGADAALH